MTHLTNLLTFFENYQQIILKNYITSKFHKYLKILFRLNMIIKMYYNNFNF